MYRTRSTIGLIGLALASVLSAATIAFDATVSVAVGAWYVLRSWTSDFTGKVFRTVGGGSSDITQRDPGYRLQRMDAHQATMLKRERPRKEAAWNLTPST